MGHKGNMRRVGKSSKKMYGPQKLLVCGYAGTDQQILLSLLKENGLSLISVIFAKNDDLQKTLKEILQSDGGNGHEEIVEMKRAIIMSGFTQKQLHTLMTAYRKAKLPAQHWATLTPVSENWTVSALLDELEAEAEAIKRQRNK